MSIKLSTGLRDQLLDTGSLRDVLASGFIRIYSGTPPASADDAFNDQGDATQLCLITVNGDGTTGLTLNADAASGAITKNADLWSGTVSDTGVATWFRHVGAADTGAASTTEPRIQGSVGAGGADMNFSSTTLTAAATQTIDFYTITLPAS